MIANFMSLLPYDFKPAILVLAFGPLDLFMTNEMVESRRANRLPECFQFVSRAFGEQLDAAIRQVTNHAGDFKTSGGRFYRIAKANTLHVTGIVYLHSLAVHSQSMCHKGHHPGRKINVPGLTAGMKPHPADPCNDFLGLFGAFLKGDR